MLVLAGGVAAAQSGSSFTWLLQNPPEMVPAGSVTLAGNPGNATYYFWIVSNYTIGNSNPAGPFVLQQAPNSFSGSNYASLAWQSAGGAASYDILRTATPSPPTGACNCAVATAVAGNSYNVTINSLSSYTVTSVDPSQFVISAVNMQDSSGVSALTFVSPAGQICKIKSNGSTSCGSGGGSPGGPTFAVQYNSSGVFGGNAAFTFQPSTGMVGLANLDTTFYLDGAIYTTVQAVINAAVAAGGGPVTIPSSATDTSTFTNSSGVRKLDFRQHYGIDSLFSRDVSEWGVKADAKYISSGISVTTGSATVVAPSGTFSSADVGKPFVCYACGDTNDGWAYPSAVASGGAGGTPGYRQVHFTAPMCTAAPTGYVQVNSSGVPTGAFSPVTAGTGCTSTPTSGTVDTVTGTVTFTSQPLIPSDLVTTIASVADSAHAVLASNVISNGFDGAGYGIAFIWGTDDTAAWNSILSNLSGNGNSSVLSYGKLTFCGFSMITAPVKFVGWGGLLEGCGWGSFYGAQGAKLISADQTRGRQLMNLQNGEGARIERIHFFGNKHSRPILLQLTRDATLPGAYIGSYNQFKQLWFGPMYDSSPDLTTVTNVPSSTNCIKANGTWGNDDYNRFETVLCQNAVTGFDSVNPNATDWDWQTMFFLFNGTAFSIVGDQHIRSSIFGGNAVDFACGSATVAGLNGRLLVDQYSAEGSTQMLGISAQGTGGCGVTLRSGGWQVTPRVAYSGKIIDFTGTLGNAYLTLGAKGYSWQWGFSQYAGTPSLSLHVGNPTGCANAYPFEMHNSEQWPAATMPVVFDNLHSSSCAGIVQAPVEIDNSLTSGSSITQEIRAQVAYNEAQISVPYRHDELGPVGTTGAGFFAHSAQVPGTYETVVPVGTTGSTTYNYQVTCISGGLESLPSAIFSTTTGNATLNSVNNNAVFWSPMSACDGYYLYGDEGTGGIERLLSGGNPVFIAQGTPPPSQATFYAATGLYDTGQFTKSTTPPPTVDQTGAVYIDSGIWAKVPGLGPPNVYAPYDFTNLASYKVTTSIDGWPLTFSSTAQYRQANWIAQFQGPAVVGEVQVLPSGVNATYGYNTIGATSNGVTVNGLVSFPEIATVDSAVNNCHYYTSPAAGHAQCLMYLANGNTDSPNNDPYTLACTGTVTTLATGWNTLPLPPNCYMTHGRAYWFALNFDNATTTGRYDTGSSVQSCFFSSFVKFGTAPLVYPASTCTLTVNNNSFYIDTTSVYSWDQTNYITTFASLPACGVTTLSREKVITDSSVTTWGLAAAGGGTSNVKVFCDGTNWTVEGATGSGGGGVPCTATSGSLQYNNAGAFGCVTPFTFAGNTITVSSAGILDLHLASVTAGLLFPRASGAAPTGVGVVAFNTTNNRIVHGDGATTQTVLDVSDVGIAQTATGLTFCTYTTICTYTALSGSSGVTGVQGNGAKVQLSTGTTSNGHFASFDSNGNDVDSGTANTAAGIVGLFSSCSGTQYLGADGQCHTAAATQNAASHNWLNSYNATTGAFTASQPSFTDISGQPSAAQSQRTIEIMKAGVCVSCTTGGTSGVSIPGSFSLTTAPVTPYGVANSSTTPGYGVPKFTLSGAIGTGSTIFYGPYTLPSNYPSNGNITVTFAMQDSALGTGTVTPGITFTCQGASGGAVSPTLFSGGYTTTITLSATTIQTNTATITPNTSGSPACAAGNQIWFGVWLNAVSASQTPVLFQLYGNY